MKNKTQFVKEAVIRLYMNDGDYGAYDYRAVVYMTMKQSYK